MNLNQDNSPNNYSWQTVSRKNSKRRQLIVGTNTEGVAGTIKGMSKFVDLHVYRINPNTNVTAMEDLLKPHFPEVICESMSSRYPNLYSSYKVRIYQENFRNQISGQKIPVSIIFYTFGSQYSLQNRF